MSNKRTIIPAFVTAILFLYIILPCEIYAQVSNSREAFILLGNENMASITYNESGSDRDITVDNAHAIGVKTCCNINVLTFSWEKAQAAIKKDTGQTFALINSGIAKIIRDGTIENIATQWQGRKAIYLTEESYRQLFLITAVIFLLLAALISIYLFVKYRGLNKRLEVSVKKRTEELYRKNIMLKRINAKLEYISMIDSLTSIENRRAFDIIYDKTWQMCLRENQPLALIAIDVDYFKSFNDKYGHQAGDKILVMIAKVIKSVIKRPGDLAARYGGEEFMVMLMNTSEKDAGIVAETIRKGVETLGIKHNDNRTDVTVSLGVAAVVPNKGIDPVMLIEDADRALYKAKEEGRNKIVVFWS